MRVIDANTGEEVRMGVPFTNIDGTHVLVKLEERFASATATFRESDGRIVEVPLIVRRFHPQFMFQKVGFVPS